MAPSNDTPEVTVQKHGYSFTYYPGFASRAVVRAAGGSEQELFEQTQTFDLPNGQTRPASKHSLKLEGGSQNQSVTIHVDDPELRIAKISVELYGQGHDPEAPYDTDPQPVETLEVANWPQTCPPSCGPE